MRVAAELLLLLLEGLGAHLLDSLAPVDDFLAFLLLLLELRLLSLFPKVVPANLFVHSYISFGPSGSSRF